ncbi:MAG: UvrD-helicase domain-containing protein [Candidatus Sumerlaeia bacterium]|nr:UvrD-helicase domain-containing protein [Candidatus Sumerlaeia bacterium]
MSLEALLLDKLNDRQREAVTHHGTPLLIVAGAGSGKTRVITHRIAWLHLGVGIPIRQILAVTFTNKAAREMRERVCALLGVPDDPALAISTFHSRCAMLLRREAEAAGISPSFAILDERDQKAAVVRAMENAGVSDRTAKPAQVQHFINMAKMRMLTPTDCDEEFADERVPYALLYRHYEELLEKNASLDFEDLIFRAVRLLRDNGEVRERWQRRFRHLLVDEFQDTNAGQFELVKLLAGDDPDVCVVGDEDQSIYSWRGAEVTNLLGFRETFPNAHLVRLEQNYRSVGNVLKAAGSVIARNTMRIGKELWTEQPEGDPIGALVGFDDTEEANLVAMRLAAMIASDGIAPADIAVFYRSHALARVLEDGLRKYRIPYRIVGGTRFYDRAEIKDLICFLRLALMPDNDLAFERVVNVPTRGVGPKALGDILSRGAGERISAFEAATRLAAEGAFKGKARQGMEDFLAAVRRWHAMAAHATVHEVLKAILEDTRYETEGVGDAKSLDGQSRLENIEEFKQAVAEFEKLEDDNRVGTFLETLALDAQRPDEGDRQTVSLMTVHNAKGLEFDHVFVVGLDQGVFPNSRTFDEPAQFEEERRLFYVALTRARRTLTLCRAMRRRREGFYDATVPSQFLSELDASVLTAEARRALCPDDKRRERDPRGFERQGFRAFGSAYGRASAPPPSRPTGGRGALNVGDRVRHRTLGEGVVVESGGRPGSERVRVAFDDGIEQEFVVKFAGLTKMEK